MKYFGHTTTYLLITVFVIIGSLLYFFRSNLFLQLEDYLIEDSSIQTITTSKEQDLIDLSILNSPKLRSMESHIKYYRFESLGRVAPANMIDLDLPIFTPVLPRNNQPIQ
jgi:hypothetical protein